MSDDTLNDSPEPLQTDTVVEEICVVSDEGLVVEVDELVIVEQQSEVIDDLNQSMEDYVESYQQNWQQKWQESIEAFELEVTQWQDSITRFELDVTQWQDHVATFKAIEQNATNEIQNRVPEAALAQQNVTPTSVKPAPAKKVKTKPKTTRT